jgi:hypothetical protein
MSCFKWSWAWVLPAVFVAACASAPPATEDAAEETGAPLDVGVEQAFSALEAADHWRERNAARDQLVGLGRAALPLVLAGARHEVVEVRRICHEILRQHHGTEPEALACIIAGLDDEDWGFIAYPAAFHLGEQRLAEGRGPLHALLERGDLPQRLAAAVYKSLGELGEVGMVTSLWLGLGSDDPYTRYLSNLGMRGLTGRDLMEFGYDSPWEGAFVSGPSVATVQGQPLEKARARIERWEAVERFTLWLKTDRPQAFEVLETTLW